jgi:hypothetical protein
MIWAVLEGLPVIKIFLKVFCGHAQSKKRVLNPLFPYDKCMYSYSGMG